MSSHGTATVLSVAVGCQGTSDVVLKDTGLVLRDAASASSGSQQCVLVWHGVARLPRLRCGVEGHRFRREAWSRDSRDLEKGGGSGVPNCAALRYPDCAGFGQLSSDCAGLRVGIHTRLLGGNYYKPPLARSRPRTARSIAHWPE